MIQIIITVCWMAEGESYCAHVEREAEVSYQQCVEHTDAIELAAVRGLLGQGFPFPLMSVTAECLEQV